MSKSGIDRMAFGDAVPPDERVIFAHCGASGAVTFFIDGGEDMKTEFTARAFAERVPFLGAMPCLRETFCDGLLRSST